MPVYKRFEAMCYNCKLFRIPEEYWNSIMLELIESGYVRGFIRTATKDGEVISMLDGAAITLDGVQFLEDNSGMKKAKEFLGSAFEILLDSVVGTLVHGI